MDALYPLVTEDGGRPISSPILPLSSRLQTSRKQPPLPRSISRLPSNTICLAAASSRISFTLPIPPLACHDIGRF
jgi:hypothetical protein